MFRWTANYLASIPPVFVDGALYVWIGVLTFLATQMSSDDAAKYVPAEGLFWIKTGIGTLSVAAVSLKMFRSSQYAEHVAERKKSNGGTQFFNRPDTGP